MPILLLDNYDSFTFNLYQYIAEFCPDIVVKRNDEITLEDVIKLNPSKIVISPGPGRPEDAGISVEVVKRFYQTIPILGVCLGHQAIALAFCAKIVNAPQVMHGKPSQIHHDGKGVFKGLPNPFVATRYHSLSVILSEAKNLQKTNCSKEILLRQMADQDDKTPFKISALSNDGVIMGIRHRDFPIEGVQFHPESILTEVGKDLIRNFVEGRCLSK